SSVGAWQSIPMTSRAFPAGNVYNNGGLDFYVMPQYIASQYTAQVTGIRSKLVDYYIEAVDARGNIKKSPIDHVYVGDGAGGGGGTPGVVVTLAPTTPIAGQNVTITYDPAGRVLQGATTVKLHYGFNNWTNVVSPDPAMTLASSKWSITVPVAATATQLDIVFNNSASTWDNNAGADWHFAVQAGSPPPPPPWVMDGIRDTDSVLVAQNGMHLWAGLKGSLLYVATEDAGEGNDHFILIAASPGAARAAMWSKAGTVAGWDAFLADENSNDYEGWFDISNAAANQAMTAANGGVLEGTINLAQELGVSTLPEFVYLAVAPYANADGGALVSSFQVPASVNSNANLDAAEYIRVPLCSLTAGGCLPPAPCPADFNQDGGVDGADVGAFFDSWEQGDSGADVNQDGGVDGADVAAFFAFWELGGC
ncbi:MAG: carbohydrate-binding protein, partial [Planctomycetota bacterium]|nr:carbohydrate-binding protein [Planctomycetota bacterium]